MTKVDIFDEKWAIKHILDQLKRRIIKDDQEITEMKYSKFEHIDIVSYKWVEDGILKKGELWDQEHTYQFTLDYQVPSGWDDEEIYLEVHIGGELEVFVEEKAMGSIDTGHDRVCICKSGKVGEELHVRIDATRHVHDMVRSERAFEHRYEPHIMERVAFTKRDKVIEQYYHLCVAIWDLILLSSMLEEKKATLYSILKQELYTVDYYKSNDEFSEQTRKSYDRIFEKLKELKLPNIYGTSIVVGHSHLDLAFKWGWKDTVRKIERTFSNTCSLAQKYEEFVYVQSQTVIFETLELYYPELFQEVMRNVKENRIVPVGDIYCEFDTNIPSGESIIRQILYGKQYTKQVLQTESKVCFLPDTFGYSGILPQILHSAGYTSFVTSKLIMQDTNRFPYAFFNWEGIDGTHIFSHLLASTYGGTYDVERMEKYCNDSRQKGCTSYYIYPFGEGDGGGGISEDMLLHTQIFQEIEGITTVEHASLEQAVNKIQSALNQIPTIKGELYFEAHRGVYTSQGGIKKGNRQVELMWRNVEILNTLSMIYKETPYYSDALTEIGKKVLFNQFHDIISGSLVRCAVEDALKQYEDIRNDFTQIQKKVLDALVSESESVTIYNTLGWKRNSIVVLSKDMEAFEFYQDGRELKKQIVEDFVFVLVENIPAFAAVTVEYRKSIVSAERKPVYEEKEKCVLENNRYRILFDDDGNMISLIDKWNKREVLRGTSNRIVSYMCRPGYFESWDIVPEFEYHNEEAQCVERICIVEEGDLVQTIKISKSFGESTCVQWISIYEDSPRIDIKCRLNLMEKQRLLKAVFEVDVDAPVATYDISMGTLERPTTNLNSVEKAQFEVNTHKWMDLSDGKYGVAILNDCKYGCDVKENVMRITLAKSANFPDPKQDIGLQEFTYAIIPHIGNANQANIMQQAYEFNIPSVSVRGKYNHISKSLFEINGNLIVETVKKAETNEDIIVRGYEYRGDEGEVTIKWNVPIVYCEKCNILEESIERIDAVNANEFTFPIRQFEIVTLRFKRDGYVL